MEFFDLIKTRRSVRKYLDKKVSSEQVEKIIEAAKTAPSAGGLKSYEILVVQDNPEKQNELTKAAFGQAFINEVNVVLVFCADLKRASWKFKERGRDLYSIQDASIACTYAQLAITDLGLASVWVGAFDEQEVKKVMNLNEDLKPVAMVPVGYGR